MKLETKRLLLRPFEESDAPDLFAYAGHPEVGPPAGWNPHEDEGESLRVIREIFIPSQALAMVLKESGQVIGSAGFVDRHRPELGQPSEEIGYSLARDMWGRGLVPEAVSAIIDYAFREKDYAVLWAAYYDGNLKSRRVMEKCGMTYRLSQTEEVVQMGQQRLAHYYAVTREEWLTP